MMIKDLSRWGFPVELVVEDDEILSNGELKRQVYLKLIEKGQ